MRIVRSHLRSEPLEHAGVRIVTVARRVEVRLEGRGAGLGLAYVGPSHVEIDGRTRRILDWHLLARVASTMIVVLLITARLIGGRHGPGE